MSFGRQTEERVLFRIDKDKTNKFYQRDLSYQPDPPLSSITINASPHITYFEKANNEKRMIPGPGAYTLKPGIQNKVKRNGPRQIYLQPQIQKYNDLTYYKSLEQFKHIQQTSPVSSFNTSDRWTDRTAQHFTKYDMIVKRIQSAAPSKSSFRPQLPKRSKFCD
ncbi:hypothetical protein SS50377_26755 [Spironucleus salmonicida]|uniref:Uncharacterized protein n=1 Tax=Spironucleus salmonicida TaxID=348837 RepID=V6M729_9EUKA|nr:hypothetical protein SS50377_26755 [Spironucleus salmonicida]|eukprot:EST49224.1 Hypothetical protein SS50377_10443 [Spironucleus salmonicida]